MTFNFKSWMISQLRKASYRYPARNEALKRARRARNEYECAHCKKIFGRKDVQIDHIEPVVKLQGFTSWDDYITRMFCPVEGYQILCKEDHDIKTQKEREQRYLTKSKKTVKLKRKPRRK
jgi:5-methylcytosine-specific restriction endonuclease McrA